MRNPTRFLTLCTVLSVAPLIGQWPTAVDSSIFVDFGVNPHLAIDSQEQSIIVVYRSGNTRLAKKYDMHGISMWGGVAVALSDTINGDLESRTRVISDGSGGAIACWEDYRHSQKNSEIYVQRVSSQGLIEYGSNGKRISASASEGPKSLSDIKPDKNGGFLVGYFGDSTIFTGTVKRFNFNGDLLWEKNFAEGYNLILNATDCQGNSFVSYGGSFGQPNRRMKLDISGNELWPDTLDGQISGDAVFSRGRSFSDLQGGIIGASWEWPDKISVNGADSTGAIVFSGDTTSWVGSSSAHYEPDSAGGIYVNWIAHNEFYESRVQRISRSGVLSWPSGGLFISGDSSTYGTLGLTANNDGGFIAMTAKGLQSEETMYFMHNVNGAGNSNWPENEVEFYRTVFDPFFTDPDRWLYSDMRGGAIALWVETGQGLQIRIKQISRNGNLGEVVPVGIVEPNTKLPDVFTLEQNYPNPFNSLTIIKYHLPSAGNVDLDLYNMVGQRVESIVSEYQSSGEKTAVFRPENLASGVYFYRLRFEAFSAAKKMLLIE